MDFLFGWQLALIVIFVNCFLIYTFFKSNAKFNLKLYSMLNILINIINIMFNASYFAKKSGNTENYTITNFDYLCTNLINLDTLAVIVLTLNIISNITLLINIFIIFKKNLK